MNTAVAIVTADASGKPVAGVTCYLKSPSLAGGFLFAITNDDGYALWDSVPVPFNGVLQLAPAAQAYGPNGNGESVSIPASQNITIRVGTSGNSNPQDIHLPACVRFKSGSAVPAPQAPREYRGQMCGVRIPNAPPVDGGASDASLILSWFYFKYSPEWRATIRATWKGAE